MRKEKLLRQGSVFTLVSGAGWLMDFGSYVVLTTMLDVSVRTANMLSSLPAITFVFFFATRHIFAAGRGCLPLWGKYVTYLLYQTVLVSLVSILAGWLYLQCRAGGWNLLTDGGWKVLVKCLITPITLCCNFLFMRVLSERF